MATILASEKHLDQERSLWAILALIGRPDGYLDIGAGDGWLVRVASNLGIRPTIGVESDVEKCSLSPARVTLLCRSLDRPFHLTGDFGLVTCLTAFGEVQDPDILGGSLARLTRKYLVCGVGWPTSLVTKHRLILDEDLTERLECTLSRSLGVFKKL